MSWLISILYMLGIILGAAIISIIYGCIAFWLEETFNIPLVLTIVLTILIVAFIVGVYGIHLKYFGA